MRRGRGAAQDYTNKTKDSPELKKKMSPTNAKAYNTMRQRLKKHCVTYTAAMDAFRAAPESEEEASEEEEEDADDASSSASGSDAEAGEDGEGGFEKIRSAKDKKKARRARGCRASSGPGCGCAVQIENLVLGSPAVHARLAQLGRRRWRAPAPRHAQGRRGRSAQRQPCLLHAARQDDGRCVRCPGGAVTCVRRAQDKMLSMDPTQITYEMVSKKLREIVTSRGKKGIDRNEQVEMLVYLATVAKGPCQQVRRRAAAPQRARAFQPALWRFAAAASVALWLSCAPV